MTMNENSVAQAIEQFLKEHEGISLHPGRTPENHAQQVIKKGGCPCVPGRPKCPCDEAEEDIRQLDHCRCYLFVNEAYRKIYDQIIGSKAGKAGRKRRRQVVPQQSVKQEPQPQVAEPT